MCGIIGYQGRAEARDIILTALTNLEYRGYDSAGIAILKDGNVKTIKEKGRLDELKKLVYSEDNSSNCGIGHTRWATHGPPSQLNSHPHTQGNVTLVHNGIIENYSEIKGELSKKGYSFQSATDTEVAAALIDSLYTNCPLKAIKEATEIIEGAYAFAIMFHHLPNRIFAIRKGSPLIAAKDSSGAYVASDLPAILEYTNEYTLIEEHEIVLIKDGELSFFDIELNAIQKEFKTANWTLDAAKKDGYDYFMLKEIAEQPRAIINTLSPRIKDGIPHFESELPANFIKNAKRIIITACGSAYYAGAAAKGILESFLNIPVELDIASEFRYRKPILCDGDIGIIISQSGETADSLAALRLFKEKNIPVMSIVNVVGSSIAREADYTLYTYAGPEIAVATTKAYTVQLALLSLMAIGASNISDDEKKRLTSALMGMSDIVGAIEKDKQKFIDVAESIKDSKDLFYIGRGQDYAVSLEGSLKLKEIAYIHSEAYAAGELKHGTLSLVTEGVPVIAISTVKELMHKTLSNIQEVRARGGVVTLITTEDMPLVENPADCVVTVPSCEEIFAPIAAAVASQLIAAYTAIKLGNDIDKPRNLAKSVTVE